MSALFDFRSFCIVLLLTVCTCTYIKVRFPSVLNSRVGFRFVLSSACGKLAGGERVANGRCMAARVDCRRGEEKRTTVGGSPGNSPSSTRRARPHPAHSRLSAVSVARLTRITPLQGYLVEVCAHRRASVASDLTCVSGYGREPAGLLREREREREINDRRYR